jgi:hypothetical protein
VDKPIDRVISRAGRETAAKCEGNNFGRELDDHNFFNPHSFSIVEALPKATTFNSSDFIDHVIIPLYQRRLAASVDIARRKLRLRFDKSPCHAAALIGQEIQ